MDSTDNHKSKRFSLSWHYRFVILPLIFGLLFLAIFQEHYRPFEKYILSIIFLYLGWYAFTTSFKVEVEGEKIRFYRITGKTEVQAFDVVKVRQKLASAVITHNHGKIRVTGLISDFPGLLREIKALNTDVSESVGSVGDVY